MRKFVLTISVSLLFIFYIIYQDYGFSEKPHLIAPVVKNSSPSFETTNIVTPGIANQPVPAPTATATLAPTPTPTPTRTPTPPPPAPKPVGQYKDGQYTGPVTDAYYGLVQVKAIISGGKITDVQFLQYPNDRSTSQEINGQAMPYLTQEAISAQSANVDIISGATQTSEAFIQSLIAALAQAKT